MQGKLQEDCPSCGVTSNVEDLETEEETDHERWLVFRCPVCAERLNQVSEAKLQEDRCRL